MKYLIDRNGEWKEYYKDGKLFKIGSYKNGKEIGEWRTFRKIRIYRDGELIGIRR